MLGPLCGAWAGLGAWGCFTIHYNLLTYITKLAYVKAPFVVPGRAWVGGAAFTIHYNLITTITKVNHVRVPFVVPGGPNSFQR